MTLITDVHRLIEKHGACVNDYQRKALARMIRSKVPALVAERDRLVAWLETADTRIRTEDVPAEKRARREDDWIAKLREYEQVMDALTALAPVAYPAKAA